MELGFIPAFTSTSVGFRPAAFFSVVARDGLNTRPLALVTAVTAFFRQGL
jgi:hypothetical protein